ncbi:aquaporin AQPAe.a-like [Schistocerca cancellata]|uniref:aquaporin AQPAe.a-like n=1 Tax=Schistocerca cancellata TaxID=274614 RepID=UPI002117E9D8|nr:aquaporin AQPAe.a-like [Schistocerca cancellata]
MCLFALKHPFTPQCVLDLIRLDEMKPWKTVVVQLAAELLGTFLLVVVGCGSTTTAWSEGYQPTTVQVALTFGLTVACIVQTLGYVSGAHVNPAVTVGLVVGGFLGPLKALLYVMAQCVGATAGSFVLQALTPNETVATLGVNALNRHVTPTQGCFVEMVISFVLVMTVYSAATGAAAAAGPFTVGMSITACHLFAMQYTGAGMNPARSFGPAFVTESWTNHWVYWVGPCVGGVAAGIVYQYFRPEEPVDASESRASPGQASGMVSGVAERNV